MKTQSIQPVRHFKVAAVSQQANAFGLHGHVLIAKDGEAWEVGRSRGPWHADTPFNRHDVVTVPAIPMGKDKRGPLRLNWALLACEIPRRLPDAPQLVVREVWGGDRRSNQ